MRELLEAERVHSIVGAFFEVYNYFRYGLSESIYVGALERELILRGHHVAREAVFVVTYKGCRIGTQRMDMVVDSAVVVESKATERFSSAFVSQLRSYLNVSPFSVGLLLHFGPHPYFKKLIDYPKRRINSIRLRTCDYGPRERHID